MAKFIKIRPCRGRARTYLLNLAYFEWNLYKMIQLLSVQLLINLVAKKSEEDEVGGISCVSIITKDVLSIAHHLMELLLLRKIAQSALILLGAEQNLIKEILSLALR